MKTLDNYKSLTGNVLSTNNGGKFGVDRMEYQVRLTKHNTYELVSTDGYKLSVVKYTASKDEVKAFLRQGK